MAVNTEKTAETFEDIVVSVPLYCNFPLYEETEVEVIYGNASLNAILNVDFTVNLNIDASYVDFEIVPLASLLTKINALIFADSTEDNYVTVRRVMDMKTAVQPYSVAASPYLSKEIDRIHMRLQQLNERVKRTLGLPAKNIGNTNYTFEFPIPGSAIIWNPAGNQLINGPNAADIEAAEGFALQTEENKDASAASAVAAASALAEAQALVEQLEDIVVGAASAQYQIFEEGTDYTAGSNTTLTLTIEPQPVNAASLRVYIDGVYIEHDDYTYDGVDEISELDTTGSSSIEAAWITATSIGVPGNKAVNWLTKIQDFTGAAIAGWAKTTGVTKIYTFVETLLGTTSHDNIPSQKAVKDQIDVVRDYLVALIDSRVPQQVRILNIPLSVVGVQTFPHGLASQPYELSLQYRCIVADKGYEAGDILSASEVFFHSTLGPGQNRRYGAMISADDTNIYFRRGADQPIVYHKSAATAEVINNPNFNAEITARAVAPPVVPTGVYSGVYGDTYG